MTERHPDLGDPEATAIANAQINAELKKQEAEAAAAEPKKLSREELLGIENIYLKMQNMQLQVQNLDAAKANIVEQMRELQKEMEAEKQKLSVKYGVDIGRHTVAPDGTIRVGQPVAPPGIAAAMAAMGVNGAPQA